MTRDEFMEKARNSPVDAMGELFDMLDAAELNQAIILGTDDSAGTE